MMLVMLCGAAFGAVACFIIDHIRGPWSEVLTHYLLTMMFVVVFIGIVADLMGDCP